MKRIDRSEKVNVHFHQAKWNEPIIYELSTPGERGVLVNSPEEEVAKEVKGVNALPEGMKRSTKLNLPEMSQSRVLRHYASTIRFRMRVPYRAFCRFTMIQTNICARFPAWIISPSSRAAVPRVS